MKHPTSSACLPTPEPAPAPLHSKQPPVRLWCPGGPLSSPTPQRRPSLRVCCLKTSLPSRTWTEIFRPSATSLPTPPLLCQPVACQPGSGRSGLIPSLPQAHLEVASIKTVCAWKLPRKTALYQWTFMRSKRCEGKKTKTINTRIIDLNINHVDTQDNRRIGLTQP